MYINMNAYVFSYTLGSNPVLLILLFKLFQLEHWEIFQVVPISVVTWTCRWHELSIPFYSKSVWIRVPVTCNQKILNILKEERTFRLHNLLKISHVAHVLMSMQLK